MEVIPPVSINIIPAVDEESGGTGELKPKPADDQQSQRSSFQRPHSGGDAGALGEGLNDSASGNASGTEDQDQDQDQDQWYFLGFSCWAAETGVAKISTF